MKKGDLVAVLDRIGEFYGYGLFMAKHKSGRKSQYGHDTTDTEVLCHNGISRFNSASFVIASYEDFIVHLNEVCRPRSCKSPKNVI